MSAIVEQTETVLAPVKKVERVPVCMYELGLLQPGVPVFECPRCTLFYNSWDLVTPQCTNINCQLKPVRLTAMEIAESLIPAPVVTAVLEAARQGKGPDTCIDIVD